MSVLHLAARRVDVAKQRVAARTRLRAIDSLGARARLTGAPVIVNGGYVAIGNEFRFSSDPACSHIVVDPGARLVIGDAVSIASGASIACTRSIHIGDGVRIGRNVMILDTDFHEAGSMGSAGVSAPVVIDDGVRIEDDVIVLKGTTIGRGASIGAGSVVSGVVPAESFAEGVPARVTSPGGIGGDVSERLRAVVDREIAEEATPDSLAVLRLLLAAEDVLGRRLPDDALAGVNSRDQIVDALLRAVA